MPYFVLWELWNQRNKVLFELVDPSIWSVINRSIAGYKYFHSGIHAPRSKVNVDPLTSSLEIIGYFDGASQEGGFLFGVGGSILVGN